MHWQILRWPFRTTALFLVAAYTLLAVVFTTWAGLYVWFAVMVLTLGLPAWYAVFGGLSIYADKLLTQATLGLFDAPFDRETDVNPFLHGSGIRYCFAHLAVFVILFYNGPGWNWLLLLPAAVFPLLWLGVLLDDSLVSGFMPRQAGRLLGGLNAAYPLAMLLLSGSVGYLHYTLLYASSILNIVASAFAFLAANSLMGHLLFSRRLALNLHTLESPEQTLARTLEEERRMMDKLIHELQTHSAAGSHGAAVARLEAFVAGDAESLDPLLHARLREFQNERLYLEHGVRYLQRLVDRGETRKAWALMKECLAVDERFRPASDETLLALTRSAGREDVREVNELLTDFPEAYPDSLLIPDALFRRARICIEILGDGDTGVHLLGRIAAEHPDYARGEAYRRYRQRLKVR